MKDNDQTQYVNMHDLRIKIQAFERDLSKIEANIQEAKDKGFCYNLLESIRIKDIESIEYLKRDFENNFHRSYRKYEKINKF